MKLLRWMQSKLSDKRANSLPPTDEKSRSESPKEELRDWRNGLLAIGTFGYTDIHHTCRDQDSHGEEEDLSEFTAEEVRSLLTKLVRQKPSSKAEADLMSCSPSSSELDLDLDHEGNIDRTIRIILGRCKKRATGKKSLSFLLKKMFVCGRRDAFQESRMEKLMRSMLTNKISNSNGPSPTKKCIEERENDRDGFKWDKTGYEFIVLEI